MDTYFYPRLFLLSLCFSLAFCKAPLAGWAFNLTVNSPLFSPPSIDNNNTCSSTSYINSYYASINFTSSTSGLKEVIAAVATTTFFSLSIFLYQGEFNPYFPCSNFVGEIGSILPFSGSQNFKEDFHFFEESVNYNFVATIDQDYFRPAEFVLNVVDPALSGTIDESQSWNGTYMYYSVTDTFLCATGNKSNYFSTQTWVQDSTGYYDIYGLLEDDSKMEVGIFVGNISSSVFEENNACSFYLGGVSPYKRDYYPFIYGIPLQAGQTYTAVISGNTTNYAVQITPARDLNLLSDWTMPDINSFPDCVPNKTLLDCSAVGLSFTASDERTIVINVGGEYYPYYGFAYEGNNAGNSTTLPQTCDENTPLIAVAQEDSVVFSSTPSSTYSAVFGVLPSSYSPSDLYIVALSGFPTQVQQVNYTTTTGTLTSTASTISTSSTSSSTTTSSACSKAPATAFYVLLLLIWIFIF